MSNNVVSFTERWVSSFRAAGSLMSENTLSVFALLSVAMAFNLLAEYVPLLSPLCPFVFILCCCWVVHFAIVSHDRSEINVQNIWMRYRSNLPWLSIFAVLSIVLSQQVGYSSYVDDLPAERQRDMLDLLVLQGAVKFFFCAWFYPGWLRSSKVIQKRGLVVGTGILFREALDKAGDWALFRYLVSLVLFVTVVSLLVTISLILGPLLLFLVACLLMLSQCIFLSELLSQGEDPLKGTT